LPLSPKFPADVIELRRGGKADMFGADCGLIAAIAAGYPEAKAVPGRFSIVRAAIALPKGQSSAAQAKLLELVNAAKKTRRPECIRASRPQDGPQGGARIDHQLATAGVPKARDSVTPEPPSP